MSNREIGQIFLETDGEVLYILARTRIGYINLISLETGNRWNDCDIPLTKAPSVPDEKFDELTDEGRFVRVTCKLKFERVTDPLTGSRSLG